MKAVIRMWNIVLFRMLSIKNVIEMPAQGRSLISELFWSVSCGRLSWTAPGPYQIQVICGRNQRYLP